MTGAEGTDLIVLVGNPRAGSRTRTLAERIAGLIDDMTAQVVELSEVTAISFSAEPAVPSAPDESLADRVRLVRLLIVATPSYKGTYTGLLKLFLDRLPHRGLEGVVALPVAVAASDAHAAITADDLRRTLEELGARVPASVAVLESEIDTVDVSDAVATVTAALVVRPD